MKADLMEKMVVVFLCVALMKGCMVKSLPYDYSASVECLAEPLEPQYGSGVVRNADFSAGLRGWSAFGHGTVAEGASPVTGNRYAVAVNRTRPYQSVSQKVYLQNDTHYTLSAWLQVSHGVAVDVRAVVKTADDFVHAGGVVAKAGCWSMLKGGLTAATAGRAELYFESNATVDIWVDSVSLKPFEEDDWTAHRAAPSQRNRVKGGAHHANGLKWFGSFVGLGGVLTGVGSSLYFVFRKKQINTSVSQSVNVELGHYFIKV